MRYAGYCRRIFLMNNNFGQMDVTVVRGGLAGMAASFHLVKAGLRVLCIESESGI
jgi:ribulose 1,5-bisphosphate synthetase/thiazole synthase